LAPLRHLEIERAQNVRFVEYLLAVVERALTRVPVPHLEHVDAAREDHVALDAGIFAQMLRDQNAPLAVEHALVRAADVHVVEALHAAVEARFREDLRLERLPCRHGIDVETATIA